MLDRQAKIAKINYLASILEHLTSPIRTFPSATVEFDTHAGSPRVGGVGQKPNPGSDERGLQVRFSGHVGVDIARDQLWSNI